MELTVNQLEDNPCKHTEHDTICDRVSKRHHNDCDKTAQHIRHITFKLHVKHGRHHKQPDKDNAGAVAKRGLRGIWGEEQGNYEHTGCYQSGKSCAAAFSDTGAAFDIAGNSRRAEDCSATVPIASEAVRGRRGELALSSKGCLCWRPNQCSDCIKQVDKEREYYNGKVNKVL